jgi:hypothetical protein
MTSRTLAAVAVVATLALAGCGGDPEPKVAEPVPSPSVSSPTVSPTASQTAGSEQAYRDFIESYVDAISRSLSTGDPSEWLAMSSPECSNCPVYADNIRGAYADGGKIVGADWRVRKAVPEEKNAVGYVWYVDVLTAEERYLNADGSVARTVPRSINYFAFAIGGEPGDLRLEQLRFREQ